MKTKFITACLLFAAVASAQEADQGFRGMVRLNKAPVSNEVLHVKIQRPVERTLSNGIKLLVLESHREPTVTLTISIPSSPLRDPEGMPGVADATAALIRQGTTTRNARQITDALSELGASINFGVGGGGGGRGGFGGGAGGGGTISVSAFSENFDAALDILADILLHPAFPQQEFDRWKARQRTTIEQGRTNPTGLSNEMLLKVLYPDARQNTRPTEASLDKMKVSDLVEHYKKYYVPAGGWAGLTGDVTPEQAVAKLEKALGGWKGGPVPEVKLAVNPPLKDKKVYLVARPGSAQTVLVIANRAIERTNPDYIACLVMNQVLGAGPASRLFRIIREEKGYTYGISSGFSATKVMQHFSASTSVRTEVTEPALADTLKEFRELRETPVPKDELEAAKRAIVGSMAMSLENPANVLNRWMQQREYGLPLDYWDTYPAKVMAVTAEEVQRVARKYVPYDNAQIIAVGDGAKIRDLLKKFGPVEEAQ
jgi:zinc protease